MSAPVALLAFMLALLGGRPSDGLVAYRDAILAATDDPTERRVLAVVGKFENTYHLHSERPPFTPPFGLTHRESLGLPRLSIAASAVVALLALRHHLRVCAARGAAGWGPALGRYHHGVRGAAEGCWTDGLAAREVRAAGLR